MLITSARKNLFEQPLVTENPLNSNDALKMKKELSEASNDGDAVEQPVYKSLFDIPGNSKFKGKPKKENAESSSESSSSEKSSLDSKSSDSDEESKIAKKKSVPATSSTDLKPAFQNPFAAIVKKNNEQSAIFSTSLWGKSPNPFGSTTGFGAVKKSEPEETKQKAPVPAWLQNQ